MRTGQSESDKWLMVVLLTLLVLRALLGIAYSLAIPLGEAPDEADHHAYAAYIMAEGKLPAGPEMTQGKHPPLYHILAAVAARIVGGTPDRSFLRANPDMAFGPDSQASNFFIHTAAEEWPWREGVLAIRAGRFVSIVAGLVLVLATYLLGRTIWPQRPELALAGAAFAAFLPESLFVSGAMSNDMLAAMWSTLALWLAMRATAAPHAGTARPIVIAALAGVCLGLAFVTKASTGSLALIVAGVLLVAAWPRDGRSHGAKAFAPGIIRVAVAGAVALLIAAPWLYRNWRLYGDLFGWPLVLATIDRRQGPLGMAGVAQLLKGWWLSFWGKFGGAGHIALPTLSYIVWAVLGIAAVLGWIAWLLRRQHRDGLLRQTTLPGWIVLLGTPLVTAAGIYSYSQTALGTDQGRLLFPALGPLALLVAGGLSAWIPLRLARPAGLVFGAGMAVLAVAALYAGLVQPYAPPPEPTAERIAGASNVNTRFGPLELVGTKWDDPAPGQLTLYWRAVEQPSVDLRTAVRLLDADDALLWEWKRSPGAGRFSTDRWGVGRVVADTYRPPQEAVARAARLEVGVRPFPEGPWEPIAGHGAGQLLSIPK